MLNLAYNILCGGTCAEDIELRRNDEVYLVSLGAERIPEPSMPGAESTAAPTGESNRAMPNNVVRGNGSCGDSNTGWTPDRAAQALGGTAMRSRT